MENKAQSTTLDHSPESSSPVLARLFESLPKQEITGHYVTEDQTWSHREAIVFSPVKHNQEM